MKFSPIYWVLSTAVALAGIGMMTAGAVMHENRIENNEYSATESFADFRNLQLEVESCSLTLQSSESAKECTVEFIDAPTTPKMYIEGDTLIVEQKQRMPLRLISFGNWMECGEVIITVPLQEFDRMDLSLGLTDSNLIDGIACRDMVIDCGVGDVTMQDMHIAGGFDLDGGTGDLFMTDITVDGGCTLDLGVGMLEAENIAVSERSDFDFGTGDCVVRDSSLGRLEMDCGVGDVKLLSTELLGDVDIQQGTGDVELAVSGISDMYSVYTESGVGDITIDGSDINGLKNKDATYTIQINCGVGDVDIRFLDDE